MGQKITFTKILFGLITIGLIGNYLFGSRKKSEEKIARHLSALLHKNYACDEAATAKILEKFQPLIEDSEYRPVLEDFFKLSQIYIKKLGMPAEPIKKWRLPEDDAVIKDSEHHKVLWESEKFRILYGVLLANDSEPMHRHYWPSILVMLTPAKFKIEYEDKTKETESCHISASFLPPDTQAASYKNISSAACSFLRFEIKLENETSPDFF